MCTDEEEEEYPGIYFKQHPYWKKQQQLICQRKKNQSKRPRNKRVLKYRKDHNIQMRQILSNDSFDVKNIEAMVPESQFEQFQFRIETNNKVSPQKQHNSFQEEVPQSIIDESEQIKNLQLPEVSERARISQLIDNFFDQMIEIETPEMELENDLEKDFNLMSRSRPPADIMENYNHQKNCQKNYQKNFKKQHSSNSKISLSKISAIKTSNINSSDSNQSDSNQSDSDQRDSKDSKNTIQQKSRKKDVQVYSEQDLKEEIKKLLSPQQYQSQLFSVLQIDHPTILTGKKYCQFVNKSIQQPKTRYCSSSSDYYLSSIQSSEISLKEKVFSSLNTKSQKIQCQHISSQEPLKTINQIDDMIIREESMSEQEELHSKGNIFTGNKNLIISENQSKISVNSNQKYQIIRSTLSSSRKPGIRLIKNLPIQKQYQKEHLPQPKQKNRPKQLYPSYYHPKCTCRNCSCDTFHCNCRRRNKKCNEQCNCNPMTCRNYHPISRVVLKIDQKPSQVMDSFSSSESVKSMSFDKPNFSLN